jgi:hypothetical protein
MKKICYAALIALALVTPACNEEGWVPTPGAPLTLKADVTPAVPLPAGVDCKGIENNTISTLDGKPIFTVVDLPTPETATIRPGTLITSGNDVTVDRSCVFAYTLK